jgi:hypothetical protein
VDVSCPAVELSARLSGNLGRVFAQDGIPSKGRRWVEALDQVELRDEVNFGTKIWNQSGHNAQVVAQAIEKLGEPSGTRTRDPLIKSQVLYLLS